MKARWQEEEAAEDAKILAVHVVDAGAAQQAEEDTMRSL